MGEERALSHHKHLPPSVAQSVVHRTIAKPYLVSSHFTVHQHHLKGHQRYFYISFFQIKVEVEMESMKMDSSGAEQKKMFNPRDFVKSNKKPVTLSLAVIGE